jgi:hypothetical protein
MRSFNLTRERRARVWFGDLPHARPVVHEQCSVSQTQEKRCRGVAHTLRRSVAVELFVPLGGRFLYGLLGCQAIGNESQSVVVEVGNFPHLAAREAIDSLVGSLDNVVPWIDEQYHDSILEGAGVAVEQYERLPERLRFCCGRQGALGSTPTLFRRLALICVSLLTVAEDDLERCLEALVSTE